MIDAQPSSTIYERGDAAPAVSVIVPLYNYAKLVGETLDSVRKQSFADLMLIVVDDASTDDSLAVVQRWMEEHSDCGLSLRLLSHQANAGLAKTRNTGIVAAQSAACFFLDADNLLYPRCIERHVAALERHPDSAGAYALIEEFGSASGIMGSSVFSRDALKRGNYIDAMAMLRREALDALGGYRDIEHGWEDYDLWLRLCDAGERMVHIPRILSRYRNHVSSMLRVRTNKNENMRALSRNMQALHPWLALDDPRPQVRKTNAASEPLRLALLAGKQTRRSQVEPVPKLSAADREYADRIMTKIAHRAAPLPIPSDLRISPDYVGPVSGSAFDPFLSPEERERTPGQVRKMLHLGVSWINPAPGVHSTRDSSGDLVRYSSIASRNGPIRTVPRNLLVHIHAFYPDILAEMLRRFEAPATLVNMVVTVTTEAAYRAVATVVDGSGFTGVQVLLVENRGRDIGPFLDVVLDQAEEDALLLHVHTKKSPDLIEAHGARWRAAIYESLLSQDAVDAFDDPELGLLFPDSSRSVGWGRNKSICQAIADHFGTPLQSHPGPVPVGNMFFVRVRVAQAMREATQALPWPREPVPYDGTVLHAIERMWPQACRFASLKWTAIHPELDDDAYSAEPDRKS